MNKNMVASLTLVGITALSSAVSHANDSIENANAEVDIAPALEVYQNGLVATVLTQDIQTGTWASGKPTGTAIGEFVDNKIPVFGFTNLKQDETAWSLFPGMHMGVEWNGYFHAEEKGNYVLMVDFLKIKDNNYGYFANSCVLDMSLSGKSVLKNSFKLKKAGKRMGEARTQTTKANSINLEEGYYPMKVWLHCGVSTNSWDSWVNSVEKVSWTFKVKRPSDRIVQVAPQDILVWK